jgi:iron complex outermembrane receptor protein
MFNSLSSKQKQVITTQNLGGSSMKNQLLRILRALPFAVLLIFLVSGAAVAQNATLRGNVKDKDTGEPLRGANVVLTSSTAQRGTAANTVGEFEVGNIPPGTYTVTISFIGYERYVMEGTVFSAGETKTISVGMAVSRISLDAVSITASRRAEKTLEAPASVSIISESDLRGKIAPSAASVLKYTTGVDLSTTGIDRREIVLRGFNNAFSGATYILTDYRQAAVPSLAVNLHAVMPNLIEDLAKVEIVRGPGSALYGPGVDAGVIHYLTKSPFTHPGTTISFSGGERNFFAAAVRHAGIISENVAYKFTGQYGQADDWRLNPNDPLDKAQLDFDAEGKERNYDYKKINLNGTLQYRLSADATLTASAGFSALDAVVLTGIGTVQGDGFGYKYGQLRFQTGRFFAQAYINNNDGGDSFVYGTGDKVVDNTIQINLQSQYDFDFSESQQLIVGVDLDNTRPDTEGTIYGRNEDDDTITEFGTYFQSLTKLSSKLDLTLAVRGDYNNIQEELQVSPRVAMVVKPNSQNSFRVTYNRAFAAPGNNPLFLDIVAHTPDEELPIVIRGRGSKDGYAFPRNPAYEPLAGTDLVARSLNPATLGAATPAGLPLDAVWASVYAGLATIPIDVLKAQLPAPLNTFPDLIIQGLVNQFAPENTEVTGFSRGTLGILNTTTDPPSIDPVSGVTNINPIKESITQTVEVGYKGLFEDRLMFAVDAYYSTKEDFVGPVLIETPFVLVPTLAADLQAGLTQGIIDNASLAATLASLGFAPEDVAALVVGLAESQLPSASTPVAIVVPEENDLGEGQAPELLGTYKNFGKVEYWGIDASFQYFASQNLRLFGNFSIVSDDFFDNEELDEANVDIKLALNAASFKAKGGFSYNSPSGIALGVSARFIKGFPVFSGPYIGGLPEPYGDGSGGVEDYFLLDLNFGYDLRNYAPGLRLDISVQNALDNMHREFIGAPEIGRLAMSRLTWTF